MSLTKGAMALCCALMLWGLGVRAQASTEPASGRAASAGQAEAATDAKEKETEQAGRGKLAGERPDGRGKADRRAAWGRDNRASESGRGASPGMANENRGEGRSEKERGADRGTRGHAAREARPEGDGRQGAEQHRHQGRPHGPMPAEPASSGATERKGEAGERRRAARASAAGEERTVPGAEPRTETQDHGQNRNLPARMPERHARRTPPPDTAEENPGK